MRVKVQLVICADNDGTDTIHEVAVLEKDCQRLGQLGLTLAELTHLQQLGAAARSSEKACIQICLTGGPSQLETWDLKPNAPTEARGEFKPIPTNVPGIQICELLPQLAKCMDKMALIRSIVGLADEHSSWQNMTGTQMGVTELPATSPSRSRS